MHADLETALSQANEATAGWLELTSALSDAQANWRPAPKRWSIAQCADHLNVTTGKLVPAIVAGIERGRERQLQSAGPFRYGFVARFFLKTLTPQPAKPVKAPAAYRPSTSDLHLKQTMDRFEKVQRSFADAIARADGLDLARIRVASPALALLRLPLGVWFLSTSSHMLRHLNQARRVRKDARFSLE